MPGIEDTIKAALLADSAVAALIGERCYAGKMPPHLSPSPWVYLTIPREESTEDLYTNNSEKIEVEAEIFAETYAEARALKDAVRSKLNRFRGGYVRRCLWTDGDYAPVEGGHNWTVRFAVWSSPVDLGAATVVWGPSYLVWGGS